MVKARKLHKCDECRKPIFPGVLYQRISGKWGREIETFKTCLKCVKLRDLVMKRSDHSENETPYYGLLFETIRSHVAGVLENCRRKWDPEVWTKRWSPLFTGGKQNAV